MVELPYTDNTKERETGTRGREGRETLKEKKEEEQYPCG